MKKKQYYNFLKPPEGNCCKLCDFSFSLLQDSSNNIPPVQDANLLPGYWIPNMLKQSYDPKITSIKRQSS